MPNAYVDDDKKRRDPYNPQTGATGDDAEPEEADIEEDADEEIEDDDEA